MPPFAVENEHSRRMSNNLIGGFKLHKDARARFALAYINVGVSLYIVFMLSALTVFSSKS